jgi:transcriptional regulator with XRE-family HTH domain
VAYRKEHQPEVTQAELGQLLGLTQGQVSRIERGVTPTNDLLKLERWSLTLGIPEHYLWFRFSEQSSHAFDSGTPTSTIPVGSDAQGDDLHRRRFIKAVDTGATTVGATLLRAQLAASQKESDRSASAEHPDVETIRQMTRVFRRLDNRYGGGHCRSDVALFLSSSVEPKLRLTRTGNKTRNDLFLAAAELYQLAGWMAYDTGQADTGRAHLRHALRLSQEAGSGALSAEMLAGMSHHAAFHGSPADAVDLALASEQLADSTGLAALKSEAAAMEAHGLALQGDRHGCLAALRNAEIAFARMGTAVNPSWLGYFDEAYLSAKFAHTFRDPGHPEDAEIFARRSLTMTDGYERGKLFNTALLASILADQRRVEEACVMGTNAVRMAQTVHSVRGAAYLADVGRRLAAYHKEAAVQSFFGHLAETGLPTPR